MSTTESAAVRAAKVTRTATIIAAIIAFCGVLITVYWQYIRKPSEQLDSVGHVLDANTLQPIVGAKVTLQLAEIQQIVYTDSEGEYQFKVGSKPNTSGQIRVDAQGYQTYTRNIMLSSAIKTIEDIRLAPVIPTLTQPASSTTAKDLEARLLQANVLLTGGSEYGANVEERTNKVREYLKTPEYQKIVFDILEIAKGRKFRMEIHLDTINGKYVHSID